MDTQFLTNISVYTLNQPIDKIGKVEKLRHTHRLTGYGPQSEQNILTHLYTFYEIGYFSYLSE